MTLKYICIECSEDSDALYKEYGKGSIQLLQCSKCSNFIDKYVEFDLIVIFIDLILLKRTAYRHIIFNRLKWNSYGYNEIVIRLAILLNLFEVYVDLLN